MKTPILLIIILAFLCPWSFAQTINWRSLQADDKHIVSLNIGWDYAATVGIGYGQKVRSKIPMIFGAEFSIPAGETLLDDLKVKSGIQAEVFKINGFSATVKVNGIFRRYESEFARLLNFGSEFSAVLGYYKPRWYVAADFGFDKAIVTHIKHSDVMQDYYPAIKSGWFLPTGGNFFYGIGGGYSFRNYDLYIKGGKTVTQDFKTTSMIPFYLQLGVNKKF